MLFSLRGRPSIAEPTKTELKWKDHETNAARGDEPRCRHGYSPSARAGAPAVCRAGGYNGATYTLNYDAASDQLESARRSLTFAGTVPSTGSRRDKSCDDS